MKELAAVEFTERLSPIFEHVSRETGVLFDPAYFFPHWRNLMQLGVARTWENDGCVLGALFTPDLFNGEMRGLVYFWFALPEARSTGRPSVLLRTFEEVGKRMGCKNLSSSAHTKASPRHLERFYAQSGYEVSELCFTKQL